MNRKRLRRNILVLFFIVIVGNAALLSQWYEDVNKYHELEDMNSYRWQRNMNENEFAKVEKGMSYLEVVEVAKGQGKQVKEDVYVWNDETVITQGYELYFEDGELVKKRKIEKRGYSNR